MDRRPRSLRQRLVPWVLTLGAVALCAGVGFELWQWRQESLRPELPATVAVRRLNLYSTLVEDGEVDSSQKTVIVCEIERVSFRNNGQSLESNGSSRILQLVPEGTQVKQGQVLCRLDSSEFEEMVRQQQVELEEDRAGYRAAELELETLEIALRAFRDGEIIQMREMLMADLTLAQADFERLRDRLVWAEQMNRLGYMPKSEFTDELHAGLNASLNVDRAKAALETFNRYTTPRQLFELESQIDRARTELQFQARRVERDEESLKRYQKQIERCTIRAPHDGLLLYSHEDDDDGMIEEGALVREGQNLFFLPNLSKMEIKTRVHETAMVRVEPGMPARVRVEALPNATVEGVVSSVAPLPISRRSWWQTDDVKDYETIIDLYAFPEGLMPGMSAQVEIVTSSRSNVLVVPTGAVTFDDNGQEMCYVVTDEARIERRDVATGEATLDLLEVVSGLSEGDQVVLWPSTVTDDPRFDAAQSTTDLASAADNVRGPDAAVTY